MDVNPAQIVSVGTALIPFLEHNDANRALMGANMQRQAVPLLLTDAAARRHRSRVSRRRRHGRRRPGQAGRHRHRRGRRQDRGRGEGRDRRVRPRQVHALEPGHDHPPEADRRPSAQKVKEGEVLADGSSTSQGELALGKNLLVAFMPFEGYNFEDAIVISERLVKDDVLSSVHIHEYEIDARATKLGDEEITRDIPNRSEESLRDLDDRGVVRIGAEVGSGDLLVGKVTPKGETELTAEEKLIRAIFKEKAREVRDTSLKVPHGEGGKVIDVKTFSREAGDDLLAGRERARARLRREEAQDRGGRQARRPPRQQGRHRQDRPRGGHAVPRGRDARRRDPEPARRAEPDEHRPDPRDPPRLGRLPRRVRRGRRRRTARPRSRRPSSTARPRPRSTRRSSSGRSRTPRAPINFKVDESRRPGRRCSGQGAALQRTHRRALRAEGDRRLHVHPEAPPPRGRQDPRALDGPVLARHPAAAGRQGAVRRPALRRDGGVGARGLRRRVHAPGDAHHQVRRHGRPRQGLRGDREGREHRRAVRSRSRSRCS